MTAIQWCKVDVDGKEMLGKSEGEKIHLYGGDLFDNPTPTGNFILKEKASWLAPVKPRQFLGLWNNFHERQQAENTRIPDFPLYFVKLEGSISAHNKLIQRPAGFSGIIKFEAELGLVIGKKCFQIEKDKIDDVIFGYTCVNDVTAPEQLFANDEFHQWARTKSFPGFGPIGPYITQGINPAALRIKGILDGEVKQDYPVSDMIFSPQEVVWHINQEATLYPGDVIALGTSVGAVAMENGQMIEIDIPSVGRLSNQLEK